MAARGRGGGIAGEGHNAEDDGEGVGFAEAREQWAKISGAYPRVRSLPISLGDFTFNKRSYAKFDCQFQRQLVSIFFWSIYHFSNHSQPRSPVFRTMERP